MRPQLALSLARILGPEIRVLTVSPAAVDTAFVPGRTTAMVERVAATTPLKRVVQADEVAQAEKIIAAFDLPDNAGKGVVALDGRMVERLHADMARRTVAIADAIAARAA